MIRSLRKRHFWLIAGIGFVTGAVLVLALAARPAPPLQDEWPQAFEGVAP